MIERELAVASFYARGRPLEDVGALLRDRRDGLAASVVQGLEGVPRDPQRCEKFVSRPTQERALSARCCAVRDTLQVQAGNESVADVVVNARRELKSRESVVDLRVCEPNRVDHRRRNAPRLCDPLVAALRKVSPVGDRLDDVEVSIQKDADIVDGLSSPVG